jgi:hypothetical protein
MGKTRLVTNFFLSFKQHHSSVTVRLKSQRDCPCGYQIVAPRIRVKFLSGGRPTAAFGTFCQFAAAGEKHGATITRVSNRGSHEVNGCRARTRSLRASRHDDEDAVAAEASDGEVGGEEFAVLLRCELNLLQDARSNASQRLGGILSTNRASRVHQLCFRPQYGQSALVTVSGSFLKLSSSICMSVENSRPVIEHFSTSTPTTASSIMANADSKRANCLQGKGVSVRHPTQKFKLSPFFTGRLA